MVQHSRGKAARHPCLPRSHHKTAGTWNDEEQRSASFQALGVQASALSAAGNLEKKREPGPARRHTHAHAGQHPTISRLAQKTQETNLSRLNRPPAGLDSAASFPPPPPPPPLAPAPWLLSEAWSSLTLRLRRSASAALASRSNRSSMLTESRSRTWSKRAHSARSTRPTSMCRDVCVCVRAFVVSPDGE